MTRILSAIVGLLFTTVALAQTPAVPIGPSAIFPGLPIGPGSNVPIGASGAPNTGGGCSNSLDFSAACNSQYIKVVIQ